MAKATEEKKDVAQEEKPKAKRASDVIDRVLKTENVSAIRKKFGPSSLMLASELDSRVIHRIPTGIFQLDYALSGGFQTGRIHEVHGPLSGGKTTVILKTIAEAHKRCANCWTPVNSSGNCAKKGCDTRLTVAAFIDVEGTYDPKWASHLGVDSSRLLYSRPDYAEQSLDILDSILIGNQCDVIALDSLAFLSPEKERTESVSQETMGLQARVLGKGFRKYVMGLNAAGNSETGRIPTLLFTNQIRMKLGVMFGNPETTPGGLAPGFSYTSSTKLWPGKYEMNKETGWPVAVDINFRVEKHKGGEGPKKEDTFKLIIRDTDVKKKGDVIDEDYILKLGLQYNLLSKQGHKVEFMEVQHPSEAAFEAALMADRALHRRISDALMKVLLPA